LSAWGSGILPAARARRMLAVVIGTPRSFRQNFFKYLIDFLAPRRFT
jgi:hypothetical protein